MFHLARKGYIHFALSESKDSPKPTKGFYCKLQGTKLNFLLKKQNCSSFHSRRLRYNQKEKEEREEEKAEAKMKCKRKLQTEFNV